MGVDCESLADQNARTGGLDVDLTTIHAPLAREVDRGGTNAFGIFLDGAQNCHGRMRPQVGTKI
jgi:hypothetical protein